jgi:hypothetical protein
MKSNYRPSDLSYYTTWWLTPTSSLSSQNTTLSVHDHVKSNDECNDQQVIIYMITFN